MKYIILVKQPEGHFNPLLDGNDSVTTFNAISAIEAILQRPIAELEENPNVKILPVDEAIIEILPHGSGFDADWKFNQEYKNGKVEFFGGYHCMNDGGYYDGWIELLVKVDPSNDFEVEVILSTGKRKYKELLRDYIIETIYYVFEEAGYKQRQFRVQNRWIEHRNNLLKLLQNESK